MVRPDIEFALSNEELEFISSLLNDQYPLDAILWLHQGMLVAPRLISIDVLPGPKKVDLLDPDFRINSIHVMATLRILGLSKFGILYFPIFSRLKIYGWDDVNYIIMAIQNAYTKFDDRKSPALWISSMVEIQETNNQLFEEEPIFSENMSDEIDFCDTVLYKAFDLSDEDLKQKVQTGFEGFIENLLDLLNKNDDTTDLTDDDVAPED